MFYSTSSKTNHFGARVWKRQLNRQQRCLIPLLWYGTNFVTFPNGGQHYSDNLFCQHGANNMETSQHQPSPLCWTIISLSSEAAMDTTGPAMLNSCSWMPVMEKMRTIRWSVAAANQSPPRQITYTRVILSSPKSSQNYIHQLGLAPNSVYF